jgi:Lipopolysaccharide-assembly
MTIYYRRWIIAWSLLLPALAGCENGGHFTLFGYTTQPTFDPNIRSVYVPIAQNTTYIRGIENELTAAVIRELGTSPIRVISDRNRADTELIMKVVATTKSVIIPNQLGENRNAEKTLTIEVVWRDLRPGHTGDILSNKKRFDETELPLPGELRATAPVAVPLLITPTASYVPELGGSNASAQFQLVNKAATQIVHMMEKWH